jgi:hypothetical protein
MDGRPSRHRYDRDARGRALSAASARRSSFECRAANSTLRVVVGAPNSPWTIAWSSSWRRAAERAVHLGSQAFRVVRADASGWLVTPPPVLPVAAGAARVIRGDRELRRRWRWRSQERVAPVGATPCLSFRQAQTSGWRGIAHGEFVETASVVR